MSIKGAQLGPCRGLRQPLKDCYRGYVRPSRLLQGICKVFRWVEESSELCCWNGKFACLNCKTLPSFSSVFSLVNTPIGSNLYWKSALIAQPSRWQVSVTSPSMKTPIWIVHTSGPNLSSDRLYSSWQNTREHTYMYTHTDTHLCVCVHVNVLFASLTDSSHVITAY